MFKTIQVGRVLGIPVTIHWTLLLLAGWYVVSGYDEGGVGVALHRMWFPAAVSLSVLLHELGHVLIARLYGIGTRSINLSPLGGIAFLERSPATPGARAAVALGGPAVSLLLALVFGFWAMSAYGVEGLTTPIGILFGTNLVLLLFNMLPIHPMDGGQVAVAAIMKLAGKKWADRYAQFSGQAGSLAMVALGIYGGILSLVLIGAFLFVVSLAEFGNPLLKVEVGRPKGRDDQADAAESQPQASGGEGADEIVRPRGIFVAFDGHGRHFAYARHWIGSGDEIEQKATIVQYAREARARGGEMRFLSLDEYQRVVLGGMA